MSSSSTQGVEVVHVGCCPGAGRSRRVMDSTISQLKGQLHSKEKDLSKLEGQLQSKDKEIERLESKLVEAGTMKQELGSKNAEIKRLEKSLHDAELKIQRVEIEKDVLQKQVEADKNKGVLDHGAATFKAGLQKFGVSL